MAKIVAAITTSVDGYITGPDDGPDKGLGEGGERLHYWVMGGPWSYDNEPQGEPEGEDAEYLNEMTARGGAIVVGRNMYEAAGHWGDKNPFGMPVFVVTHRPEEEPETGEFTFVGDFEEAIDRAKAGRRGQGGEHRRRRRRDPAGARCRHRRRAPHHRRAGHPRGRQAPLRGLHEVARSGEPGRAAVPVGDLHRVRGEAVSRGF